MDTLNDQLHKGLAKETHPTATTKCFPTYVQDLPQGTGKRTRKIHIIDIESIVERNDWVETRWNVYLTFVNERILLGFIEVIHCII